MRISMETSRRRRQRKGHRMRLSPGVRWSASTRSRGTGGRRRCRLRMEYNDWIGQRGVGLLLLRLKESGTYAGRYVLEVPRVGRSPSRELDVLLDEVDPHMSEPNSSSTISLFIFFFSRFFAFRLVLAFTSSFAFYPTWRFSISAHFARESRYLAKSRARSFASTIYICALPVRSFRIA
jgi:hypothetical protein